MSCTLLVLIYPLATIHNCLTYKVECSKLPFYPRQFFRAVLSVLMRFATYKSTQKHSKNHLDKIYRTYVYFVYQYL